MEAKRRWATGLVVLVALVAGGGGAAYLYKEAFPTDASELHDGGAAGDASAKTGRGKPKSAKKIARPGSKPRVRTRPNAGHPGVNQPGNNQGGVVEEQSDEVDEEPEAPFVPPFRGRGPAGPTYEAALASNKQEIVMGGKAEPDLTDAQLHGPMRSGSFVGECGAPDSMKVTVKVAIKQGRPAGVSVSTTPLDPDIAGCIDRYVRTFSWPSSNKMDSFTTTY